MFSTGSQYQRVHGLTHKTSDAGAVPSHARPNQVVFHQVVEVPRLRVDVELTLEGRSAQVGRERLPGIRQQQGATVVLDELGDRLDILGGVARPADVAVPVEALSDCTLASTAVFLC
jgi:hypothetical protein